MRGYRLYWCTYWRRYLDTMPPLVIFVATDGTAYAAADPMKLLRQKRLGKAPKPKAVRPKRHRFVKPKIPKPTHEAPRRAQ